MLDLSIPEKKMTSEILIEEGIFKKSGKLLNERYPKSRFAIVTDSKIKQIYGKQLNTIIPRSQIFSIPSGEKNKNLETIGKLTEQLIKSGISRSDVIIGFGGGIITDIAGFLASVYMRGIKYIAIPTSLLGMVDASVGGKTGIDLVTKNILGTFYLPELILMDTDFLMTFQNKKRMSGFGEIVKYAAIADKSLFRDFEKNPPDLNVIIEKCVKIKVGVVQKDFKENGMRKILNYGHTFGHAIESASDYKITHDEAISIGMVISNKIAQKLGKQDLKTAEKIKSALIKFNLPTELPKGITIKNLRDLIKKDKKRAEDKISFIIVPCLGSAEIIQLTVDEMIELAK